MKKEMTKVQALWAAHWARVDSLSTDYQTKHAHLNDKRWGIRQVTDNEYEAQANALDATWWAKRRALTRSTRYYYIYK